MKINREFFITNNTITIVICLLLAYSFVLLCSTTTSPLFLSNPFWHHGDSGIFQEMGLVIARGGVPYLDVFDHKGPVLFFIQALGLKINEYWGIYFIQGLSLSITILCWNKIISVLQKNTWIVWGIIIIALIFLFGYYQRGNMCEEWSLPFISFSIYLFIKHLPEGMKLSSREWFVVGLCTCSVIFIRANNIAPILGFALYSIYSNIKNNKNELLPHILSGLLGCTIIFVFWVLLFYFFYGKNALSWMIYGTFLYNFDYIQKGMDLGTWHNLWFYASVAFFVIISIVEVKNRGSHIAIPLIASYLISVFAIGSNKFIHYTIIFIPLFVVSMALIRTINWSCILLLFGSLMQAVDTGKSGLDVLMVRLFKDTPTRASHDDFSRFISSISVVERNDIYNLYALPTYYFAESKLVQRSRCVMGNHVKNSTRLQTIELNDGLVAKNPTWILITNETVQQDSADYVYIQSNYFLKDSIVNYEGNGWVYCYRRNINNGRD